MALSVPLSRFTPRVGGGSAFFVRPHSMTTTDSSALVDRWFSSVRGVSSDTLARLRPTVQHKLDTGALRHEVPKAPADMLRGYEVQRCVEQTISEQWDSLTPEERLLVRFPTIQAVGQSFEVPKRGTGVIIRRELTRRFGVEMTFQLRDGSFFTWEFID